MADDLPLDRFAMKDRSTAHLRIFVGGINDQITADDLLQHFSPYGRVMGIIVARGFGFVQYEEESQVHEAINQANNSTLMGRTIQVKPALTTDKKPEEKGPELPPAVALSDNNFHDDNYARGNDYGENDYPDDQAWGGGNAGRGGGDYNGRGGRGRGGRRGGGRDGFRDRSPIQREPRGRFGQMKPGLGTIDTFRPTTIPDKNDCEIIVVSKALTEYAEFIEDRLKRLGIVVDLLFPMPDVPIGKVLGNIASRGCLYAILVMPENQEHRSLTLTILHGVTQEHRNMPIEDALQLMMRNFADYRRGVMSDGKEAVMGMLGQLADGKTLTVLQYDKVIQYLQDKRELQVKIELGEPLTPAQPIDTTKQDLQNRIMSILSEKKAAAAKAAAEESAAAPRPKLLNDPNVKMALDSLLNKFM